MKPTRLASLLSVPLVAAGLAGCGDNLAPSATGDHAADAAIPGVATAVLVAGDFNVTGVLSTVRVPQGLVHPNAAAGVAGGDPVLRRFGDELFVVNRFNGDNVTVLARSTLGLVGQYATGPGSNPQDVAPVGRKLYVTA